MAWTNHGLAMRILLPLLQCALEMKRLTKNVVYIVRPLKIINHKTTTYSTVQLQLHITTRYHACQCVQHAKSSRVPRRDSVWHKSMATSNIAMHGHAWQLIIQDCNM